MLVPTIKTKQFKHSFNTLPDFGITIFCVDVLLFYKVLTSGSSLMNKYADHAFNGILKVSFTIVGDSMSLYVILIGVTLDVFPAAYILERPFWSTIRIPAKCPLDDNSFTSLFVVESPE